MGSPGELSPTVSSSLQRGGGRGRLGFVAVAQQVRENPCGVLR